MADATKTPYTEKELRTLSSTAIDDERLYYTIRGLAEVNGNLSLKRSDRKLNFDGKLLNLAIERLTEKPKALLLIVAFILNWQGSQTALPSQLQRILIETKIPEGEIGPWLTKFVRDDAPNLPPKIAGGWFRTNPHIYQQYLHHLERETYYLPDGDGDIAIGKVIIFSQDYIDETSIDLTGRILSGQTPEELAPYYPSLKTHFEGISDAIQAAFKTFDEDNANQAYPEASRAHLASYCQQAITEIAVATATAYLQLQSRKQRAPK